MYHRSCRFVKWTIEEATDLLAIPLQLILLQIPIRMIVRGHIVAGWMEEAWLEIAVVSSSSGWETEGGYRIVLC